MKRLIILLGLALALSVTLAHAQLRMIFVTPPPAPLPPGTSAMAQLAASMSPGTWAELTTIDMAAKIAFQGGASNLLTGYADKMAWDPVRRKIYFFGGDHQIQPQFLSYTDSDNTWRYETLPPWSPVCSGTCGAALHGYNHSTTNPVTGVYYTRQFGTRIVHRYDPVTQVWTDHFNAQGGFGQTGGVAYVPELGGVVWAQGSEGTVAGVSVGNVYLWTEATNVWSVLASNLYVGYYQQFAEYNPVHHVTWLGGGNAGAPADPLADRHTYKLTSAGVVTQLADTPVGLGTYASVESADPVTGLYVVLTRYRQFYTYNIITDTWALQPAPPDALWSLFTDNTVFGITATSIPTYGVVFFTSCNYNNICTAWLYKGAP